MNPEFKYPRTKHILGSRLLAGQSDPDSVPFSSLQGKYLVFEEKLDGTGVGIDYSEDGDLRIQVRGQYILANTDKQFDLLFDWARIREDILFDLLTDRFVLWGEWLFASHTEYYDCLPDYFMEFDIYDKASESFLSTELRHQMLKDLPVISVPVLWKGPGLSLEHLQSFVSNSLYKTKNWRESLKEATTQRQLNFNTALSQRDNSDLSEGLYVKHETNGRVVGRYKYVRADFVQCILDSKSHWRSRPILPNKIL